MIFFQKVTGHEKLGSKYKALFIVPGAGCQCVCVGENGELLCCDNEQN